MAISKVDFFGKTLVDLTSDTVDAQTLKAGYTAHGADGELVEGVLGKKLTFRPGSTLRLNVELADADGNPYTMAAGEVLKLHMWHGADTIDAESETTEVSVEVPADAPTRPWHWTLVLKQSAMNIMVALGDARCFDEGDISFEIVGVVDGSRKVSSSAGFSVFAYSSNITTLGDYWFESLLPRTIQALNATSLGVYVITQCSELRSLELPATTTIDNNSLAYCDMVEHLELPALESAGNAFAYSCKRLKCIELPALKSLGYTCFAFGSSLRVVALPGDELCNVAARPLYSCPFFTSARDNIGRIYVNDALVDDYKSATNWSAFADYIYPISEWDGSIPESKWDTDFAMWGGEATSKAESILDGTLRGHVGSESITNLRWGALGMCTAITSVDFPNVTKASGYTFYECRNLKTANMPSLKTMESYGFQGCASLTRLDFPCLIRIQAGMFYGCQSLNTLILRRSDDICYLNSPMQAFDDTPIARGTGYIYVPAALIDTYKTATNWSVFADQFRAIEDYPEICDPE